MPVFRISSSWKRAIQRVPCSAISLVSSRRGSWPFLMRPPSLMERGGASTSVSAMRAARPRGGSRSAARARRRDDDAGAFENFSRALDASPGKKGPKEEMEMIAARLRSKAVQLTPEKFSMLQGPLEQAAKHNVLSAQMLLGEWLRKSDPQAALKWFAAAAAQGQTEIARQSRLHPVVGPNRAASSAAVSNTCGAISRRCSASPSLRRMKALVV